MTASLAGPDVAPALSVRGVRHAYGAVPVLQGVDLDVRSGEVVGVVGPNGAGKTTLVDVLTGAVTLQEGRVVLGGDDVSRVRGAVRTRHGLARTHQVPRPFTGMTVFENVLVGATAGGVDRATGYDRAARALVATRMTALANRPAGALGLLDRKRLELARALALQPRVLLLDEVAGGLTDAETDDLVDLVGTLSGQGLAVVWIEHLVHVLVRAATRLVCLAEGTVIADGPPDEVIASPRVQQAYYGGPGS
ncbi:ABC transporter ATP-binding protein [Kineosporia sp. A_224]|uniref:ABC transporter ATP-binding protein n=1 Tax=Kineosporia sp. A_224 TaxID=1962180 RepID=UPI000B4B6463|nr:ATP-binding cassette domain-containing protein [Kineosporia sp. A_224]